MKWEKENQFWYFNALHCLYNVKIVITGRELLHFSLLLQFSWKWLKEIMLKIRPPWQCLLFSSLCKNFDNFDIFSQHWLEFSARGGGGRLAQCSVLINRTWPQPQTELKIILKLFSSSTRNFYKQPRCKMWDIAVQRIKYKAKSSLWEVYSIRLHPSLAMENIRISFWWNFQSSNRI